MQKKITITATLTVDLDSWAYDYGMELTDVQPDVISWAENCLQQNAPLGLKNVEVWGVDTVDA